jgi:SAM-dependent methyltransferase
MGVYKDLPTFNTSDDVWHHGVIPRYFFEHARKVAAFLEEMPSPILDLGEANPKIRIIQEILRIEFSSCGDVDFDFEPIPGSWGTILCLEILEHLYNPLLALTNMRSALAPGGVIYLSTPGRPHFLWSHQHFHEIDDERIRWLFRRAGLEVLKEGRIPVRREWWWHLRGIRPFLRLFTHTRLYKLRPSGEEAARP